MKERIDWTGKLSFWDDFSVVIRSDLFPLVVDGRTAVSQCFWLRRVVHIIHYSYIYSDKTVPIMEYLYISYPQEVNSVRNPQWTLQSQIYWLVSPQIIINRHLYVLSLYIYISLLISPYFDSWNRWNPYKVYKVTNQFSTNRVFEPLLTHPNKSGAPHTSALRVVHWAWDLRAPKSFPRHAVGVCATKGGNPKWNSPIIRFWDFFLDLSFWTSWGQRDLTENRISLPFVAGVHLTLRLS